MPEPPSSEGFELFGAHDAGPGLPNSENPTLKSQDCPLFPGMVSRRPLSPTQVEGQEAARVALWWGPAPRQRHRGSTWHEL